MTEISAHRKRRAAKEVRFRWYGRIGLGLATLALAFLLFTIISRGAMGFVQTQLQMVIPVEPTLLVEEGAPISNIVLKDVHTLPLIQNALRNKFPLVSSKGDLRKLYQLVSVQAEIQVKKALLADPSLVGKDLSIWVSAADSVDRYHKSDVKTRDTDHSIKLNELQKSWIRTLSEKGDIRLGFHRDFFTKGDSRSPERAGYLGAIIGSLFTLFVCMGIAFPLGVLSAIYLEEFAGKGRITDIIEVNINNLAAVPSIVFGLLGLSVYLGLFGMPRSASVVGGMTLALMILPTLIITTRASLKAIPDSIRDGARALGASPMQVVFHHVVPLAMPGIMTGTILGMARAIGETAPLLMIGMVAFVADVPTHMTDAATVMPVQIYLWASSPEISFVEKTSAGIMVLLAMLLCMNAAAIFIRKKFEHRW